MNLFGLFGGKKESSADERRERLLKTGRITEGRIIDGDGDDADEITKVVYFYTISGADYESSETLTLEQRARPKDYAPGAKVSIRYDPRQPGNSIVV